MIEKPYAELIETIKPLKQNTAQILISFKDGSTAFISYESIIAIFDNHNQIVKIYPNWNYSPTTSKYFNMALQALNHDDIAKKTQKQKQQYFQKIKVLS